MRVPVVLPEIGMKSTEIEFGAWLKSIGSRVVEGEELLEVEVDKATVVIEAEVSGTLVEILVSGGSIREGDVLAYIETDHLKEVPRGQR